METQVKAWGFIDSTGAILNSSGIISVTRCSAGTYRIFLAEPAPNANYVILTSGNDGYVCSPNDGVFPRTPTEFQIVTFSAKTADTSDSKCNFAVLY